MASFRTTNVIENSSGAGVTVEGCQFKDSVMFGNLSWEMYSDTTQTLSTTLTKVTFNTEQWDTDGGVVDLANNRAVVPYTGKYLIMFNTTIETNGAYIRAYVYVNGTLTRGYAERNGGSAGAAWKPFECIVEATAGQAIEIYALTNTGTTVIGEASFPDTQGTRMTGLWISE